MHAVSGSGRAEAADLEQVAEEVVAGQLDRLLRHDANHVGRATAVEATDSTFPEDGHEAVPEPLELSRVIHLELRLSKIQRVHGGRSCVPRLNNPHPPSNTQEDLQRLLPQSTRCSSTGRAAQPP